MNNKAWQTEDGVSYAPIHPDDQRAIADALERKHGARKQWVMWQVGDPVWVYDQRFHCILVTPTEEDDLIARLCLSEFPIECAPALLGRPLLQGGYPVTSHMTPVA